MTADARQVLDRRDVLVHPARQLRDLARRRQLLHRVPVDRGIDLRRVGRCRRDLGREVHRGARLRGRLGRVREPVAANPDLVVGRRQIGDHEAARIVGDDDLREPRRERVRLGDHPHAGFGALRARDDAADVVRVDRGRLSARDAGDQKERKCGSGENGRHRAVRRHDRDPPLLSFGRCELASKYYPFRRGRLQDDTERPDAAPRIQDYRARMDTCIAFLDRI